MRFEEAYDGYRNKRLSQSEAALLLGVCDRTFRRFYSWYRREGSQRSYSWVKNTLQAKRLVKEGSSKGGHRKRRPRCPLPGMMLHQDGSTHHWVEHNKWDLIVTMDDATNEYYSMFNLPPQKRTLIC